MRKKYVVAVLLLLIAATAYAGFVGPRTYYSDAAMTQQIGSDWINCNGTVTNQQGTTTSGYRRFEGLFCHNANDVVLCHQWNGSSWVSMTCPW